MGAEVLLLVSVFLACAVEAVEALTIVVAIGVSRTWRAALTGAAGAVAVIVALVAALGTAVTSVPLQPLRLVIGGLLATIGLQWLCKAIQRAGGHRRRRDEIAAFRHHTTAAMSASVGAQGFDRYGVSVSFKGVLLEGLEVVFIVISFGANRHQVGPAAAAAAAAVLAVSAVGAAARRPLARVPENTIKFAVGVMLSSFGAFWGGEGAGAHWPGGDLSLLGVLAITLAATLALTARLRSTGPARDGTPPAAGARPRTPRLLASGQAAYGLLIGGDWRIAGGVTVTLAACAGLASSDLVAWWVTPLGALATLSLSLRRDVLPARRRDDRPSQHGLACIADGTGVQPSPHHASTAGSTEDRP